MIRSLILALTLTACRTTNKIDDTGTTTGGVTTTDADGDGYTADVDCDDEDASVHPDADEVCDGVDNNCDGSVDEGVGESWYADADGDGYGDAGDAVQACGQPSGRVADHTDCDDGDAAVNPDADEVCDDVDNNCDGQVDEGLAQDWYADADGDGYGDPGSLIQACAQPTGTVTDATDCDDTTADAFPGNPEVCDGLDNNCDGTVDEGVTTTYYPDVDGDGYGDPAVTQEACELPVGYSAQPGDCDDSTALASPDGTETCDGLDNDCDGDVDEADATDATDWYADADGDGYGDASSVLHQCYAPTGYVSDATDCDDASASVSPGATEVCDGIDDDCDGLADDDDGDLDTSTASTWYADADADGYGDSASTSLACDQPTGTVADATDCDDASADINPGAAEVCNTVDDDCDGLIDDDDSDLDSSTADTWYGDTDGDGYGDASDTWAACDQPTGYVSDATDCDDDDSGINPAATETCDGVDEDCDGDADNGVLGSGAACAAESCLEILDDGSSTGDGDYSIDFDGTVTTTTCDMTTDGGGWTLIFSDDFESTPDAGWSLSSTYSCGSWSTILGGYGNISGGEIDITLDTYGITHTEAWAELVYVALDSWDGETAYVSLDGTTVWSQSQNNHSTAYSEVCGWNRGYYGSYDSEWDVSESVSHTGSSLVLMAGSTLDQSSTDESFGLDDVFVWIR